MTAVITSQVVSNNMTCVSYVRHNDSVTSHISGGCVFFFDFHIFTHPYGMALNHGVNFTLLPVSHSN